MNAKTCKKLRRFAGVALPSGHRSILGGPTRYLPLEYFDRHMMVQDLELDASGNLPTNDDGTPKMKRFDYLVVKPIRVNPEHPRGRYLDLKRGHGSFASTGLSIRVGA